MLYRVGSLAASQVRRPGQALFPLPVPWTRDPPLRVSEFRRRIDATRPRPIAAAQAVQGNLSGKLPAVPTRYGACQEPVLREQHHTLRVIQFNFTKRFRGLPKACTMRRWPGPTVTLDTRVVHVATIGFFGKHFISSILKALETTLACEPGLASLKP